MLERTDAITNEVLDPFTFVLAYSTLLSVFARWDIRASSINKWYGPLASSVQNSAC
jgi:hypothetical protein